MQPETQLRSFASTRPIKSIQITGSSPVRYHLPALPRPVQWTACILFLLGLAVSCYRRPISDDFDRYIYEAIVLGKSQAIQSVYDHVKHENPRAEASSVLDSPLHLQQLEPLYSIRPIYLEIVSVVSRVLPIQHAINFISAISLLGIGLVVLLWTGRPLETALLLAAYPVLNLGRMGTPDALAALLAISAVWLIHMRSQNAFGVILLFLSLGVRTDNILFLLAILIWMTWEKQISPPVGGLLSLLAVGVVVLINRWAGNYGWIVLFRYSFVSGRYPVEIPHVLTVREYLRACAVGATTVFPQLSLWLLLAFWSWMRRRDVILLAIGGTVLAHFVLFPSPEVRYLLWACILMAVFLIRSFQEPSAADCA